MIKHTAIIRTILAAIHQCLFLSALLCTLLVASSNAQTSVTDGSTPLGLAPGAPAGAYALSGLDNINYFNGNLNFKLPLLSVGGRGSAGYTMTLPIDQRWRVLTYVYEDGNGDLQYTYNPDMNWWAPDNPGYGPGRLYGRSQSSFYHPTCGHDTKYIFRLTFIKSDGTEYELRDPVANGEPKSIQCLQPVGSLGRVFVTTDGSGVTFLADTDIIPDGAEIYLPTGNLMFSDGTRYRINNGMVDWK